MAKRWDLFRFLRFPMYVAFMYSPKLEQLLPKALKKRGFLFELMIEIFLYFVIVHIAVLYMCTIYLNFHRGDLKFLVNCLMQLIVYLWTIFMKLYFRRLQGRRLENLIDFMNFNYKVRSAIGFSYVTMDECYAVANKWLKLFVYSCFTSCSCWLFIPITYGGRSLPLTCWYPFDYKKPVIYEIIYFLQSVGQIQVAAAFASSTGFHVVLCILISGQYDVLCCSLKNIFAKGSLNKKTSGINKSERQNCREPGSTEPDEYYCSKEMKSLAAATAVSRKEKQDFRWHYRRKLKECVHHHHFILECLTKMETFYNPFWLLKTGEVIVLMCLVAFASVKTTTADSFIAILSLAQYLFMVAAEFLLVCYFGEMIFLNSQRCFNAVLRSPWYLYMPEIKNDFLIFLQNTKKPFQLTAGKIIPLNVECFRGIMKTAFSFLTVLQNIDERNE